MNADTHRPVVSWLQLGSQGPCLEGHVCSACDAVYLGPRAHCSRCFARDSVQPLPLRARGRLYAYSIVHRSFPDVLVPYVSAIVDLDGGGTVKGNLIGIGIDPDPQKIRMGNVSYFFEPAR